MFIPAMMLEFWWKAFLASIITVIVAKIFGCGWNIFLVFSVSFIGWTAGFLLLIAVSDKIGKK